MNNRQVDLVWDAGDITSPFNQQEMEMTQILLITPTLSDIEMEEEARKLEYQQENSKPCAHCGDRVTHNDTDLCEFCDEYLQGNEEET